MVQWLMRHGSRPFNKPRSCGRQKPISLSAQKQNENNTQGSQPSTITSAVRILKREEWHFNPRTTAGGRPLRRDQKTDRAINIETAKVIKECPIYDDYEQFLQNL